MLTKIKYAMIQYEKGCPSRIQHFLKVHSFAKLIGELEGLDEHTQYILEATALVHDIGIKPAIEIYGSGAGPYQEKEGFKEITLLGQNVDSYNDEGKNLSWLLRQINSIEGNFRIRFVTNYPTDITEELIDTVIELDKVCEYFHIPMQSGDDYVLKKMNRRYDVKTYKIICEHLRSRIPDVTITSDFIAGFPGETEEQFQNTLNAMTDLELDYSNTAAYSPRERTVAAKWTDLYIPDNVKEERLARLNEHNRKCCLTSNQKYIGREMEVLIENFEIRKNGDKVISGRTRNNKIVHIKSDKNLIGEFVMAKITHARTWYLNGELL